MRFQASKKSLDQHIVPAWFHDAKLGIFIHWGLYSVPAYAPTEYGDITATFQRGSKFHFAHNPYAEWYLNSLKLADGPYQPYHQRTYGSACTYDSFAPMFNDAIQTWDPEGMADNLARAGARYVVLTTKHHDGFLLWPSANPNPLKPKYYASRDIVGELAQAVTAKGMRMGFYYSGALDWTFNPDPIDSIIDLLDNGPDDPAYAGYVDAHYLELIDKYAPSVLWNDIGYPIKGEKERIVAHFYNVKPDGVVNDRWMTTADWFRQLIRHFPFNRLFEWLGQKMIAGGGAAVGLKPNAHFDFRTPEYAAFSKIRKEKWETCRGLGRSFGYNRMENDAHYISITELVHMLVDVVSKNGNLLLNVGPEADGSIPELQLQRLHGLGNWLKVNGEAIFDTRPWEQAEGTTTEGIPVRFTQNQTNFYAILLGKPETGTITIRELPIHHTARIHCLGFQAPLQWHQQGHDLVIQLPERVDEIHALAFRISKF